jgi:hypothetical protein
MFNARELIKTGKRNQLALVVVFIMYLLLNVQTPKMLAGLIDNLVGNAVVVLVALYVLMNYNPVVGALGLVVAYELIRRSGLYSGTHSIINYLQPEKLKFNEFADFNNFPVSLEEDVVSKMAPLIVNSDPPYSEFTPVLDDLHDAAGVDYDGVV